MTENMDGHPSLGSHWIADVAGCDAARLTAAFITSALLDLPDALGLQRVGEPQVVEHCVDCAVSPTIAGIVLIAESHVSIHAFPAARMLHADVFSCRPLDYRVARDFVVRHFGAKSIEARVFSRGVTEQVRRLR